MDLRQYYLENVSKDEYYYNFFDFIKDINYTYNIFEGKVETNNYKFIVSDTEDAIEKFKNLCQPENESFSIEDKCWFYLILFYLHKNNFIIEEFPRLIEQPPDEPFGFVNKDVRNKLILEGKDCNGRVPFKERRKFIAALTFKKKQEYIKIDQEIEQKFKETSTRNASFENMSKDEKISEIANLIEYFLKKGDFFVSLDYSKICLGYIDDEIIKKYRKNLHCFRHASEKSLQERANYTEEQKNFIIDYGLTILKSIHVLLKDYLGVENL